MTIVYLIVIFLIFEYLIAIFKLSKNKFSSKIFLFIKVENIQSNKSKMIINYCIWGCLISIFSLYLVQIKSTFFLLAMLIHCIILSLISKKSNIFNILPYRNYKKK